MKRFLIERLIPTSLEINNSFEGEPLEIKVDRILTNKEPIEAITPRIFTKRADGVLPEYNIRADRFDLALDATDHIAASMIAQRQEAKVVDIGKTGEV